MLAVGRVVDDPFDVGLGQVGQDEAGGDDGAAGELTEPLERLDADRDRQQRAGPQPVGGGGGRAHRHFDEGVGTALLERADRAVTFVAQAELFAEAVQLFFEDGATDRVEHGVEDDFAAPAGADRGVTALTQPFAFVLGRFGVDAVFPVVDDTYGVGVPRRLALFDEGRFVAGEGGST